MKIQFFGATETVTGSKHLLITSKGKKILLDCGLFQLKGSDNETLNRKFDFNPSDLDAVILSHAHIDHSGNLPYLVNQGFTGKIYCTPATYEVCEILLEDSANIHQNDIRYINKKRKANDLPPLKALYTDEDVKRCLKHFRKVPFHAKFRINDEVELTFTDAGHILGSAVVNLNLLDGDKLTRFTFTGDIGRYNDLLLKNPECFPQADYIICESTYGNRLHPNTEEAEMKLLNVVRQTCVDKKGKLIIPAFSLGRTQEIVYALDRMKTANLLPEIKVYVDSPLSTNATNIMRDHLECLNESVQEYLKKDSDPFGFNNLIYITDKRKSQELNYRDEPCIIISASGMMEAGRVKHHLAHAITDEKNTVLIVGYCAPGSLGKKLIDGHKEVKIFGEPKAVRAQIEIINSYSAHADYKEMIQFLSCQDKKQVKEIFLVHGENDAKIEFKNHLNAEGYARISIPRKGEIFSLE
jgi:metallo-beta-lactamase family protein